MVITFTYKTQFGEDRFTEFRVTVVTDPQTHTHTHTHTHAHSQTEPTTFAQNLSNRTLKLLTAAAENLKTASDRVFHNGIIQLEKLYLCVSYRI